MLDIILEITLSCLPLHMLHCSLTILQQIVWTCLRPQQQWMKSQASAKCKGPRWFKVHLLRFCCHIIMQPWRQCCCLAHYFKKKCALAVTITNKHKPTRVSFHCRYIFLSSAKGLILIQTLRRDKKKLRQSWDLWRFIIIHSRHAFHSRAVARPLIDFQTNLAAWQLHFLSDWKLENNCANKKLESTMKSTTDLADSGAQKKFLEVVPHPASQRFAWRTQGLLTSLRCQFRSIWAELGLGSGGLVLTHYWLNWYWFISSDFFCCIC